MVWDIPVRKVRMFPNGENVAESEEKVGLSGEMAPLGVCLSVSFRHFCQLFRRLIREVSVPNPQ